MKCTASTFSTQFCKKEHLRPSQPETKSVLPTMLFLIATDALKGGSNSTHVGAHSMFDLINAEKSHLMEQQVLIFIVCLQNCIVINDLT